MDNLTKKTANDVNNQNDKRIKEIDAMISKNEIGVLTECAYGVAIGDLECKKKIIEK